MVSGAPPPVVTWERTRGEMNDPNMYKTRYDARGREHILEVRKQYFNKENTLALTKDNFGFLNLYSTKPLILSTLF